MSTAGVKRSAECEIEQQPSVKKVKTADDEGKEHDGIVKSKRGRYKLISKDEIVLAAVTPDMKTPETMRVS